MKLKETFSGGALKEDFNFSYYKDKAALRAQNYVKMGNSYVKDLYHGDYEHTAMDLQISLKAPYISLPLHPDDPTNADALFFDFGNIKVNIYIYIYLVRKQNTTNR